MLTLCILTTQILSCSSANSSNGSSESENKQIEYVYFGNTAEGTDTDGSLQTFGIQTEHQIIEEDSTRIPFPNGAQFTYAHSEYAYLHSESNEFGSFYSRYHIYRNDIGQEIVISAETNAIVGFDQPLDTAQGTPCDETELKEIAAAFMLQFFSQSSFSKLQFESAERITPNCIALVYRRQIEGYLTDETVMVLISPSGSIASLNGTSVGKFDTLLSQISKQILDDAHQRLKDKIESNNYANLQLGNPILTTNTSGKPYLYINYSYTTELGVSTMETLYTNID